MNTKPNLGAFNQGTVSTIACFNKTAVQLGVSRDCPSGWPISRIWFYSL